MAAVKRLLLSVRAQAQAYLVHHGGVLTLIDAGTAGSGGRVLRGLEAIGRHPRAVRQIVLTHCHGDHSGDAVALREATGAPVVAGAADAAVIAGTAEYPGPRGPLGAMYRSLANYPRLTSVDVRVTERHEIEGGLVVVPSPGHTAGHVAVYAPELGAVFVGDAVFNLGVLRPSWATLTQDRDESVRSIERLAALEPQQAYFGHGPPLREGATARLQALAAQASKGAR